MANPTYPRKSAQTATQPNVLFGPQAFDANRAPFNGVENGFVTKDATGTPVVSPVSPATNSNTVLVVPTNATSVVFVTTAQNAQVSEDVAFGSYLTIPVNVPVQLDIARQSVLYLRAATSGAVVSFAFQIVD